MNDPRLNTAAALLLKFRLEAAINAYQNGEPLIPLLDFSSEDFEITCVRNVQKAQRKMNNTILVQYFGLGLWIRVLGNHFDSKKSAHRIGVFLYDYFKDCPTAIGHLEEVNPTMIDKAGKNVLRALLTTKKQPQEGWGPTLRTQGDMWQATSNLVDSPHYSPRPITPPTPPRINVQQEVQELEEFFGPQSQESLLLCAPYTQRSPISSPCPLKRSRVSD
jgi:hypothetical protein